MKVLKLKAGSSTQGKYKRHKKGSSQGGQFAKTPLPSGVDPKSDLGKAILASKKATSLRIKLRRKVSSGADKKEIDLLQKEYDKVNSEAITLRKDVKQKTKGKFSVDTGGKVTYTKPPAQKSPNAPKQAPKQNVQPKKKRIDLENYKPPKTGLGSSSSLKEWDNVKTLSQAENLAKNKFNATDVNFTGANLRVLKPSMKEYERLYAKYPRVGRKVFRITTEKHPQARGYIALAASDGLGNMALHLNKSFYSNRKKMEQALNQAVAAQHFQQGAYYKSKTGRTRGDIKSIISHEFGHFVDYYYNYTRNGTRSVLPSGELTANGEGTAKDTLNKWKKDAHSNIRKYAKHSDDWKLSKYGRKSPAETFAESFAAYESGKVKTKPVRQMGILLNELLNAKKVPKIKKTSSAQSKNEYDSFINKIDKA